MIWYSSSIPSVRDGGFSDIGRSGCGSVIGDGWPRQHAAAGRVSQGRTVRAGALTITTDYADAGEERDGELTSEGAESSQRPLGALSCLAGQLPVASLAVGSSESSA